MNFPNIKNLKRRREIGSRWGKLSAAAWQPSDPDHETLRKRTLWDRKGEIIRQGATYHGDGRVTNWLLRHAIEGRTDQYELVANGEVFKTGGLRKIPRNFRPISLDKRVQDR